ncbi:hypothetical protein BDZ91DRAFT_774808 [Kalaharituber pfeilii]|nr:hypothetical protein BDZ91DRAFT_774808 [Kalaharituber pfeilii]
MKSAKSYKVWGWTITRTSLHPTREDFEQLRANYDTLSDLVLDELEPFRNGRDLYDLLKEEAERYEKDGRHGCDAAWRMWAQVHQIPGWVNWEQIARGQLPRYSVSVFMGLCFLSLLGGMGANRIVETLAKTGGFSPKSARRRMFETTQHILQCCQNLESIKPGGQGFRATLKVRLLHAQVRRRILNLVNLKPEYFDVETNGIPINDLDSIATIISFSASLMFMSLPRQGLYPTSQEIADYLALWRLVAHYMGVPTNPLATPAVAKAYMESLWEYEINPSPKSQILSRNIIVSLTGQPPLYTSADYLVAQARWLVGDELCNALGLPGASFQSKLLMGGQCLIFCFYVYSGKIVRRWERSRIERLKKVWYQVIVGKRTGLGEETDFEFKYIPSFVLATDEGKLDMKETRPIAERGWEHRSLCALIVTTIILALVLTLTIRAIEKILANSSLVVTVLRQNLKSI